MACILFSAWVFLYFNVHATAFPWVICPFLPFSVSWSTFKISNDIPSCTFHYPIFLLTFSPICHFFPLMSFLPKSVNPLYHFTFHSNKGQSLEKLVFSSACSSSSLTCLAFYFLCFMHLYIRYILAGSQRANSWTSI